MTNYPIFKEIVPVDIFLENIYLDPNNPRFVDSDWTYIPDKKIHEKAIQDNVQMTLETKYSVNKLVTLFESSWGGKKKSSCSATI